MTLTTILSTTSNTFSSTRWCSTQSGARCTGHYIRCGQELRASEVSQSYANVHDVARFVYLLAQLIG